MTNNTWSEVASDGPRRWSHSLVGFEDTHAKIKLLTIAGIDGNGSRSSSVWRYDLDAPAGWELMEPLPVALSDHVAAVHDGHVYVYGGRTDDGPNGEMWRYAPSEDSWSQVPQANPPAPRYGMTGVYNDDRWWIYGGQDGSGDYLNEVWVFDFESKQWRQGRSNVVSVSDSAAALTVDSNGVFSVLTFGGQNSSGYQGKTFRYTSYPNLVISPSLATLYPGGRQQFLVNVDYPVEWSAAGGYVNQNGLYMAGGLPGYYHVTVIDRMEEFDSVSTAVVQVIGADPCPYLGYGGYCEFTFGHQGVYPYYDPFAQYRGEIMVVPTGIWSTAGNLAATTVILITATGFEPPTVTIHISDTVRWVNTDSVTHTIRGGLYYHTVYLPLIRR